jgi:hypothetical protein
MFNSISAYVNKSENHMHNLMNDMNNIERRMEMLSNDDPIEGDYLFNDVGARRVRLECVWEKKSNELWEFFDSFYMFTHRKPKAFYELAVQRATEALAFDTSSVDMANNMRVELDEALHDLAHYN